MFGRKEGAGKSEIRELEKKVPVVEDELMLLMLPKDPNDDKNIILETKSHKTEKILA